MSKLNFNIPHYYSNRELSWLAFNERVMELACDDKTPLLEKLRYLCICSSNLDEFYEVRVAGVLQQIALGVETLGPDQLTAEQQLAEISQYTRRLISHQYRVLNEDLLPSLKEAGIGFLRRHEWTPEIKRWASEYFTNEVIPVISPLGLDQAHPFPRLINKGLNFVATMNGVDPFGRNINMAVIQAPRVLPRIIPVPQAISGKADDFVFLSSVIHANVDELFPGMDVTGFHQFRVTRNTDLYLEEEAIDDLLSAIKGELPRRHFGDAVRLEVADTCPDDVIDYLLDKFNLSADDLFQVNGPVNLSRMVGVLDWIDRPDLLFPSFTPSTPKRLKGDASLFDEIKRKDIYLHHPYQSFMPVVDLLRQAAKDPNVLAIKQTVYRAGKNSPIIDALMEAALAGKEVTVVIELRARFDEEANVNLADQLFKAGCQVVYGMMGYKTHAKLMMVVRREENKLVRYAHLGTGNYHVGTARVYTDYGLMTCNPTLTEDVHKVFMQITGAGQVGQFKKLLVAPNNLLEEMLVAIAKETENAKAGKPAYIGARMNSLVETRVIHALYEASCAGVKIDLVVRGICCLRPNIKGVSENIRVRTVLGQFLEHSRIFYFKNAGDEPRMYLSSADWMPRNLYRRVEVAFPVENAKQRDIILKHTIEYYFKENVRAWDLNEHGEYVRVINDDKPFSAQNTLIEKLR